MSLVTPDAPLLAPLAGLATLALRSTCWLAFWLAIALPGVYLPLLALGHIEAGLLGIALHALAVVLGQGHGRRR
jgi:hypothetical protein